MPATMKAAAAAARAFAGGAVSLPLLAGSVALEQKIIQEKAEMEAKWLKEHDGAGKKPTTKELAAHEMPSAPKFN
ncbi:hypothetical protein E4T44_00018 [Aureobasidium sp. EXF-8845]|nr:hypothetical protein E4T44_00018 [Aureobasidium sp. EXF-8845]KAI4858446.1 hypothetical protein E4T45_00035 [Aureobasidium sp. EXF-8846]